MGLFDKLKRTAAKNADKVSEGVDKAAEIADERTGHRHSEAIDNAAEKAKDAVERLDD